MKIYIDKKKKKTQLVWNIHSRFILNSPKLETPQMSIYVSVGDWIVPSKGHVRGFPGGPVVKSLPANGGDVGLIPGQGTKVPHSAEPTRHSYWNLCPVSTGPE